MISGKRHQQEMARLQADREWWMARLPRGWRVSGFYYRETATAFNPGGQVVDVAGPLVQAFYEQKDAPK